MYSLLVVDDEKVICEGLKHRISMLKIPQLDSIKTALNGQEALKIIDKDPPDIIITDIRMPEVGGLELIETVSKKKPNIKFLVLSGYETYDYIRSAFKLGAVDYLLKPISSDDLEYHLCSLIKKLDNEQKLRIIKKRQSIENSNMLLSQLLLSQYMHPKIEKDILSKLLALFPYNFFTIGIIAIEYNLDYGKNLDLITNQLDQLIKKLSHSKYIRTYYLLNHSRYPVIIFNISKKELYPQIVKLLESFTDNLRKALPLNPAAAVSSVMKSVCSLKTLYSQAEEAASYRILHGSNRVIEYCNTPNGNQKIILNKHDLACIDNAISLRSAKQFNLLIDKYFNREFLKTQSIENVKKLYYMILKRINDQISDKEHFAIEEDKKDFEQFFSLEEIKSYLKDYMFKILHYLSRQDETEKSVVDIAVNYLKENYMKEVNMAEVSNMVSMNYSYFSKLFKTQTGMTFSEYLLMLRMEEAKKLLNDPVNRICEVSSMIGYENAHNFSRAFKSYFGISPKEYRKKM